MTMDNGGSGQNRTRWLYRGLVASLALNMLLVGGMAAAAWHHRHGPRGDDTGLMGFARHLPGDRQQMVREEVMNARAAVRPLRQAIRAAWDDANKQLAAEPFDKDKIKQAMDKLTEAEGRLKAAITTAFTDTAAKLTPEERRSLGAWREAHRPEFGRHRHRPEGPGRDDDWKDEGPPPAGEQPR